MDDDSDEVASSPKASEKKVRLLDYACGTGLVSRVRPPFHSTEVHALITLLRP